MESRGGEGRAASAQALVSPAADMREYRWHRWYEHVARRDRFVGALQTRRPSMQSHTHIASGRSFSRKPNSICPRRDSMITSFSLKSRRSLRAGIAVIAACIVAAAAAAADAATPSADVPSITVRYADLDLTTEQGAHNLYRRIQSAARFVCPSADLRDLKGSASSRSC